jgi:hypothetical protein
MAGEASFSRAKFAGYDTGFAGFRQEKLTKWEKLQ